MPFEVVEGAAFVLVKVYSLARAFFARGGETMKKHLLLAALLLLAFASISFGQEATPSPTPKPKPRMSKAQIQSKLVASEKRLWEAWKNKDAKPFKATLAADGIGMGENGP